MFCENCGKPMQDNARFCTECGYKVSATEISQGDMPPKPQITPPVAPVPPVPPMQQPLERYPGSAAYANPMPPVPKKKRNKARTALIISATIIALALIGVLLWLFVFGGNELEGTSWVGENGMNIVFEDAQNGYLEQETYDGQTYQSYFTYTIDGNKLTLEMKDTDHSEQMTYKLQDDRLILTEAETYRQLVFYDANKSFTCEYCNQTSNGKRHMGQLNGYSYSFCDKCWEEVQSWLD